MMAKRPKTTQPQFRTTGRVDSRGRAIAVPQVTHNPERLKLRTFSWEAEENQEPKP